jgi:hypothetical protein
MWKPKDRESYYYITQNCLSCWVIISFDNLNEPVDKYNIRTGNYFRTKKQAKEALRKIKAVLRDSHKGEK